MEGVFPSLPAKGGQGREDHAALCTLLLCNIWAFGQVENETLPAEMRFRGLSVGFSISIFVPLVDSIISPFL